MAYVIYEISQAKQRFATQLITKSITQTESELDNFFERVHHLIQAVEQQYELGFWNELAEEKTILHNISIIDNYAPISSIGIADRRGYEMNVIPDTLTDQWLTRRVFVDQWGFIEKWERWNTLNSLTSLDQWESSLSIDPRERPWFKGAVRMKDEVFWTQPYQYTTGPEIGITASLLLQTDARNDSLAKIIAFDLTLRDLNDFIQDLQLTENQNIFLLSGDNSKIIALHNYTQDKSLDQLESSLLLSPQELGNQTLLNVLQKEANQSAFSFSSKGQTWWGILRPYTINKTQKINIVSVLPEDDFALEISRTLWVGIGSFFLILVLSFIVAWNHNKLHRISNVLIEKNKLISRQKEILFSEVHHRVKNNLALISAFLELDLLNSRNREVIHHLGRNQQRIKSIAIIQEEAYKSDALGTLHIQNLVSSIINSLKSPDTKAKVNLSSEDIAININQALRFGLLLNELLYRYIDQEESSGGDISIEITQKNDRVTTTIRYAGATAQSTDIHKVYEKDVIQALLRQLGGTIETSFEDGIIYKLDFKLKEQKGIVSNKNYKT